MNRSTLRTLRDKFTRERVLLLALVGAPVALNLWLLRAERLPVLPANDGVIHLALIRRAAQIWAHGHIPLDGWLSTFSAGFPVFHHYQALPHIVSGLLATLFSAQGVYSWSIYVLLSFWPVAVYIGGRLLGWSKAQAGTAAFLSPVVALFRGGGMYGYEYRSYVWGGYGVWPQLWAMWLLPFSWGLTWRAVTRRGGVAAASAASAAIVAFHFLTGYLAFLAMPLAVLIKPSEVRRRVGRAVALLAGGLLIAAWVIVPYFQDSKWGGAAAKYPDLRVEHVGAARILRLLVTGRLFDEHRLPLLTSLLVAGIAMCVLKFGRDERGRFLVALWAVSFLLLLGRGAVGPLVDLLPGGSDIQLQRFITGVHLAGIYLAGIAGAAIVGWIGRVVRDRTRLTVAVAAATCLAIAAPAMVAMAWSERAKFMAEEQLRLKGQQVFDKTDGRNYMRLVALARKSGPGRMYSGTCFDAERVGCARKRYHWGHDYVIFGRFAFMELANAQADIIGYSYGTGSIVVNVEARFDESNPAHYRLFNIRYLIFPAGRRPQVPARFVKAYGRHRLWEVDSGGYLQVIDTRGTIQATQVNFGRKMQKFLSSADLRHGIHPTVALEGARAEKPLHLVGKEPRGMPGVIRKERGSAREGSFSGEVVASRKAAVMLKASFHGRWQAEVDGRPRPTYLVAPGYVAVTVPRGRHAVSFRYHSYPYYPELLGVGVLTLLALSVLPRFKRRGDGVDQSAEGVGA